MMPLIITGPTASGKTALSLALAEQLGDVDILVADSKQVYKGMDIVTGKDLPGVLPASVRLFGIDIVNPNEEWSVAHFVRYGRGILDEARRARREVIIVGGTGLYIDALFAPPTSLTVPRSETLRMELERLPVSALQDRLQKVNAGRFESMNHSDRQNPRRLIRAIEVTLSGQALPKESRRDQQAVWVGISLNQEILHQKIHDRVISRLEHGAIEETKLLEASYPDWTKEARSAIGYREIHRHLLGEISRDELVDLWTLHELQYAKRQLTWLRPNSLLRWIDGQMDRSLLVEQIKDWYT